MILELAKILDSALCDGREIERLTAKHPELNLDDAYRIQDEGMKLRFARGEKQVGLKMGFTSQAKREQMGLGSPIYGVLTDRMQVANGAAFSLTGKIHPKIEPEVAFHIGRDLKGRISSDEAWAACSGVACAMEILDSRFTGFKYFSLPDVVADNCSSSYFVLGPMQAVSGNLDLANLDMVMEIDGKVVQSAKSSAISGHPVKSLVQLCEMLDARGLTLKAGSVVLAGAATAAVQLTAGMKVRTTVEGLGEVLVTVA
jgi:2-oxo-3-hexenedioate decarboxylase